MKPKCILAFVLVLASLSWVGGRVLAQEQPQSPTSGSLPPANLAPWFTQAIDGTTSQTRGAYASLAVDEFSHTPYISYYDAVGENLMLARPADVGGNCGPENTWRCDVIDGDGLAGHRDADVGHYSSLAIFHTELLNGLIGIAYLDNTNHQLRYAQRSCQLLTCSWTYETIAADAAAMYASLKLDSTGTPQVAFYHSGQGSVSDPKSLQYAKRQSNGTWAITVVDTGTTNAGTGLNPSLALNSVDAPSIAYWAPETGSLKLAYLAVATGNCGPASAWQCDTIDGSAAHPAGMFPSLHLENPSPVNAINSPSGGNQIEHIAYYDATDGLLKHATNRGDTPNCGPLFNGSPYWQCDEITNIGEGLPWVGISLDVDLLGYPIIAYANNSAAQASPSLNIARPNLALHTLGNCGPLSSSPLPLPTWKCTPLASEGQPGTTNYPFISLALDADGMGYLTYNEFDEAASYDSSLKLAFQQFAVFLPVTTR